MPSAYIGIGSNLGDRLQNCKKALRLIEKKGIRVKAVSSPRQTRPWGGKAVSGQPDFINMAAALETDLPPRALLEALLKIENEMGRVRTRKWEPRIIDLDILLYEDEIIDSHDLKIPHPMMHERQFVLGPLAEIAPEAAHPVFKKTIRQLLQELITG